MSHVNKIRIGVLRGGPSSEYDISLKSGETVLTHTKDNHHPVDIFISKNGVWHVDGMEKSPSDALRTIDVVFNALHGEYGEDGQVQKILDQVGVPYTGSDAFASAIAMNKDLTKKTLKQHGIKMPYHKVFTREQIENMSLHELFRNIPHPSIVKPVALGSSIGVSLVKDFFDLGNALQSALAVSDSVMIEEYIEGREASCGVIEGFRGEELYSLLPIEIIPHKDSKFFDFVGKYEGKAEEICPGNFDDKTKAEIQELTKKIHEVLGLKHYSRSDFIVHPKRGIYFIEVNTLPGLTEHSLIPKALNAIGVKLSSFFDHVVGLAKGR